MLSVKKPDNNRQVRPLVLALLLVLVAGFMTVFWLLRKESIPEISSDKLPPVNQSYAGNGARSVPDNFSSLKNGQNPALSGGKETIIQYGSGAGQIGVLRPDNGPLAGPESFTVGGDGNVYLTDQVNQRILVYSKSGEFLRAVSTPTSITVNDLTVDGAGNLYVYDHAQRNVAQLKSDGELLKSLSLDPSEIDTMGFLHLEGQSLYFAKAASLDLLIGTLKDGEIEGVDATSERTSDGIHGASGQIYALDVNRGQGVQIRVHGEAENFNERTFSLALPGILSAVFLGEDQQQQFYVQTETGDGESVSLAVQKIGSDGKLLKTIKIPANDYAVATLKLLVMDEDGGVVQFLPQKNQAVLQSF